MTFSTRSRKRKYFFLLTVLLVMLSCFLLGELVLRFMPIPGVRFSAIKYNDLVGRGFYPKSVVTYRSDRGEYVVRKVNRWGYLDVDHDREKKDGVFRIGFFGDSYTEAQQVNIESTFFQIIEQRLKSSNVECLAFGYGGFGTVHSYLLSLREMDLFELDLVVYVFVENDVGDNIRQIKQDPNSPCATLKQGDLVIDHSFRERNRFRTKWPYKVYQYLIARSLLLQTLKKRLQLLLDYGIKTNVAEEDRNMTTTSDQEFPDQNDLPSSWPDSLKSYATSVASSIILKWKNLVESKSKMFAVIYVPRKTEWRRKPELQDSWKPWIESFCHKENIHFIDPTDSFFAEAKNNKEIYYDHFTVWGHQAFADAFVKWFKARS